MLKSSFFFAMLLLSALFTSACSPSYVIRAAYEQGKILLARRPIEEVIKDPTTSSDDAAKLKVVLDARRFASDIGLTPGGSFTKYADIGKDTLAWIVMASRRDSFDLYTWWFPIVGTVPYKGFFNLGDAKAQAAALEQLGYETSVRGTEAFSTLGWFNDPVLSTTLRNTNTRIVNTVIHESVHSTVWIPNHVAFNESLANFVGLRATLEFFTDKGEREQAQRDYRLSMELAERVGEAFKALSELYARKDLSSEEKIAQRQGVFNRVMGPYKARYPDVGIASQLNNAELLQSTIYMTELAAFAALFEKEGGSWERFFKRIIDVRDGVRAADQGVSDPFGMLKTARVVSGKDGNCSEVLSIVCKRS